MSTSRGKRGGTDRGARPQPGRPGEWPVARWIDRASDSGAPEDRAAALFRRAATPASLTVEGHQRVRQRLRGAAAPGRSDRRHRVPTVFLHWGVAAGLLFGSGAVIAGRSVNRWWHPTAISPSPGEIANQVAPATPPRRVHPRSSRQAANLPEREIPAAGPPADEVVSALPAPAVVIGPASRAAVPSPVAAPPVETALAAEVRLLNSAITRLRHKRDPAGALSTLDTYMRRFPGGTLAVEADTTRVEALLLLGKKGAALAALERLPLAEGARGDELRAIRGELRAAHGDCAGARADFDALLTSPPQGTAATALSERALYGRAVCQFRSGLAAAALRDAESYLVRFPRGSFVDEARSLRARVTAQPPPRSPTQSAAP